MQSCKRSKPESSGDDDNDDDSEDNEHEDEQSKKDFHEFKAWLDTTIPAGSNEAPSKMMAPVASCKTCGNDVCQCISLQFISYYFIAQWFHVPLQP